MSAEQTQRQSVSQSERMKDMPKRNLHRRLAELELESSVGSSRQLGGELATEPVRSCTAAVGSTVAGSSRWPLQPLHPVRISISKAL